MKMQRTGMWVAIVATAALAACGERPQALGSSDDVSAYQGSKNGFEAPGWKAGDKISWEQALKARGQNTQNEYNRTK